MATRNYEDLLLEKKDGIATITLNAPDKLNALTISMRNSLPLAVDEVAKDDEVRVVIVTGAGRAFCAGGDVVRQAARAAGEFPEVSRHERLRLGGSYIDVFPNLSKPVIAAVNGPCVGGGLSIAMSCDIRIASETARFSVAQVARGLVPDAGLTYYLPHSIGFSKALELMFTAKLISAIEAERLGIVSRVIPPDELMKVTQELAVRIAQQPPVSLELTKKIVWRSQIDALARQIDLEAWAGSIASKTEDHKESVRAFLEKRPPAMFKGK